MRQHLASVMVAMGLLAPLTAAAWEKPVVVPFTLPDSSYIEDVTPDGTRAVFNPDADNSTAKTRVLDVKTGSVIELPVTLVIESDGEDMWEPTGYDTVRTTSISEDGTMLGGSYGGDPAYYKDGKWYKLPFPNQRRSDIFAGYEGEVRKIRRNGEVMIGYAYDAAFDIKPVLWINGELVDLPNLPDRDWKNFLINPPKDEYGNYTSEKANMQFCDISPDGRWLLGGMSLNHPGWGCCYFLYDLEEKSWFILGLEELNDMIGSGEYQEKSELEGSLFPTFSPDGTKIAGLALLVKDNGTPYPDDNYTPFVYDLEKREMKFYNELASDLNRGIMGVTNDGQLWGWDNYNSIGRSTTFRSNNMWYDIESIFSQAYDMDFMSLVGLEGKSGLPFYLSEDGRSVLGMGPSARSQGYYVSLPDRSFFEAAVDINLMKPYEAYPAPGSLVAVAKEMIVRFDYPCTYKGGQDIIITSDGQEEKKAVSVEAYNTARTQWSIKWDSTVIGEGNKLTVNIPAGLFVKDESDMANEDITVSYNGREEKPLELQLAMPAAGSRVVNFSPANMLGLVFDYTAQVAPNSVGYLYQEGSDRAVSTFNLSSSGTMINAYPVDGINLEDDIKYEFVLPAGSIVDITGHCGNEEIRIPYVGAWTLPVGDFETIFALDFDDMATSLSTMKLMYEGDHLTPNTLMQSIGFDADNTPWNFSVRETTATEDRVAASHSMYNPAGQSDDWMVTPQVKIDSDNVTLEFDAQGYRLDKEDRLKVIVYPSDDRLNGLDAATVAKMRENGDVIYDEIVDPGASADVFEGEWTHVVIPMDAYVGKNVYIAFVNENENQSAVFLNNLWVRRNGIFAVGSRTPETVAGVDEVTVRAYTMLTQGSSEKYSSIEANLIVDGKTISTYKADGLEITPETPYQFSFPEAMPLKLGVYNPYTVEVTLTDGDKKASSRYAGQVGALTHEPVKRVVLEEGTGTWCGNCPRGIVAIEKIEHLLPENFIPVSIHNGDAMAYSEYEQGFLGFLAYPSGRVNRRAEMLMPSWSDENGFCQLASPEGNETFYDYVLDELSTPAVVGIDIASATVSDGKINVKADVQFALEADHLAYNIFTLILENGIQGRQTNYASGSTDPFYGEWATAAGHVVTTYNDVARGIAGISFNGESGYIPETVTAEEVYTADINLNVPASVKDDKQLTAVCMIIDMRNEGRVVNAAKKTITDGAGIESVGADNTVVNFTLSGGKILANGSDDVEVYNLQGQRVANAGLQAGLYVARSQGVVAKILVK